MLLLGIVLIIEFFQIEHEHEHDYEHEQEEETRPGPWLQRSVSGVAPFSTAA